MLKLTWKIWLAVWIGIGVVTGGITVLLQAQGALIAAQWALFVGNTLGTGWTLFGLFRWREVPWVKRLNAFAIVLIVSGLVVTLFRAVQWQTGAETAAYLAIAALGFLAGINLLRLLLRPGHPILGVARTMIEEALRMGIALIFIIALMVILVVLPLILGSEDRVTYMVQRFLTYSTGIVSVLLGLMTVLLAARTVSLELSSRQAHMTLTKPLSRWQYLLGKWLGIVMLNAVLVAVGGVAIYGFTLAIAESPAMNEDDRKTVHREVLTARLALTPDPLEISWNEMYANVLREKQQRDPNKFGQVGDPIGALAQSAVQEVLSDAESRFYTVDGGSSKPFRFEGLASAAAAAEAALLEGGQMLIAEGGLSSTEAQLVVDALSGKPVEFNQETVDKLTPELIEGLGQIAEREVIQLVLQPDMSPEPDDQIVEVALRLNGVPWPAPPGPNSPAPTQRLVLETPNEIAIPARLINSEGELVVTIEVPRARADGTEQPFVRFNHKDSRIQLFYRVSSFEANLARGMALVWLKLCFLTMFGLVAGSLMSFPVAAMASLIIFTSASFSGAIQESLADYASFRGDGAWNTFTTTAGGFFSALGNGEVYDALRILLRVIGESFMLMIPSFGSFPVADPLSNGKVISNGVLLNGVLKIGLLWTGVVAVVGLYLFSRKEIARVTV